ncbi:hypothetical protein VTK26DRAFT_895 [Humicola hyalothermophila]
MGLYCGSGQARRCQVWSGDGIVWAFRRRLPIGYESLAKGLLTCSDPRRERGKKAPKAAGLFAVASAWPLVGGAGSSILDPRTVAAIRKWGGRTFWGTFAFRRAFWAGTDITRRQLAPDQSGCDGAFNPPSLGAPFLTPWCSPLMENASDC